MPCFRFGLQLTPSDPSYGRQAQTRTEHLRLAAQFLGWRPAGSMEHDSPTLFFQLACQYLVSARVIRPGPDTLVRRVAHAHEQAQGETYDRLPHEFTTERCVASDALLVADPSLSTGPVEASASAAKAEVDKLGFLPGLAQHLQMGWDCPAYLRITRTQCGGADLDAIDRGDVGADLGPVFMSRHTAGARLRGTQTSPRDCRVTSRTGVFRCRRRLPRSG
ncbi:hypothetical protein RHDE110596_05545 [Prescottella defluvii]|nr:hypothetical protein [Prescottella defluvii]